MLFSQEAPSGRPDTSARPVAIQYETLRLHPKSPFKYALVRRDYQTHYNFTDFLPFSGIQTWALGDEPPIIHPTPLAPSTTIGERLDTARQGVSRNWGLYGGGAMGINGRCRMPRQPGEIPLLVARYDWFWRVVFFADRSTVVLEFDGGEPGPNPRPRPRRTTLWTLNRIEPAEPAIEHQGGAGVVRFAGREACLHALCPAAPKLVELPDNDAWATGVRQLEYDCGTGPVAFAFSDGSFRFGSGLGGADFRFADATGSYEAALDSRFFTPTPGNLRIDPWQLAEHTIARRAESFNK
jgi:hypothetical protein